MGTSAKVREGDLAPDFELPDQHGEPVRLSDHHGRWVVVYFYPQDDTPGCTAQSCAFRDSHEEFVDAGAVVIGVSGDSVESHEQFAEKHSLPFTLLSDADRTLRDAWSVGRSMGLIPARVTYVIDPEGVVRKVFSSQLRAARHQREALEAIRRG